jgi:hypothetical protein
MLLEQDHGPLVYTRGPVGCPGTVRDRVSAGYMHPFPARPRWDAGVLDVLIDRCSMIC